MRAPSNVKEGQILDGKFRVERILGVGGMGVVAAARHLELGIDVAVKLLLPGALGSDEAIVRFAREARSASRLRSEHVARVYDVGRLADGTPYMVMEYLVGRDLDEVLLEEGPLDVPTAAAYVLQVCEAMAEAHAHGIVHRDLKPKNLFLTKKVDGSPLVKVLDFGIAKRVDPASAGLTGSITVVGSPAYMSPEQMRASRDVDARSDVWSLGVSLYELTTGVLPFDGESELEVCAGVMKDEPRRPNAVRRDLPPGFADLVMQCLRKRAADRLPDVAQLAEGLEGFAPESARGAAARVRQVLGVAASPPSTPKPTPPSAARHAATQLNTHGARKDRGRGIRLGVLFILLCTAGGVATGLTLRKHRDAGPVSAPVGSDPSATAVSSVVTRAEPTALAAPTMSVPEATPSVPTTTDGRTASRPTRAHRGPRSEPQVDTAPAPMTADPSVIPNPSPAAPPAAPDSASAPTPTAVSAPAPPAYVLDAARVQVGSPASVVGTTATNIGRALAGVGARLTACYRAALPGMVGTLEGAAVMHLGTDEEGVIVDVRVAGGPSAASAPCIVAAVRGRQVANVDTGRVRADVPLQFFAR